MCVCVCVNVDRNVVTSSYRETCEKDNEHSSTLYSKTEVSNHMYHNVYTHTHKLIPYSQSSPA